MNLYLVHVLKTFTASSASMSKTYQCFVFLMSINVINTHVLSTCYFHSSSMLIHIELFVYMLIHVEPVYSF